MSRIGEWSEGRSIWIIIRKHQGIQDGNVHFSLNKNPGQDITDVDMTSVKNDENVKFDIQEGEDNVCQGEGTGNNAEVFGLEEEIHQGLQYGNFHVYLNKNYGQDITDDAMASVKNDEKFKFDIQEGEDNLCQAEGTSHNEKVFGLEEVIHKGIQDVNIHFYLNRNPGQYITDIDMASVKNYENLKFDIKEGEDNVCQGEGTGQNE